MALGLGGLSLAVGVMAAQLSFAPMIETEAALRAAMAESEFDAAICPDGWAADHAALLGETEAEVTAWYLRDALTLSDEEVISAVGFYVTNPRDFRHIQGEALTQTQIVLCIAESRRLTTPLEELVPPELRSASLTGG